jgi:hypothetical protein
VPLPLAALLATLLAALISLLMLTATPALAHPFVTGGGRVPVDTLATITLDLAHGCGDEQQGAGADTDEVALEVPAWLRVVDVPEPDGWRVTLEDATPAQLGAGVTGVVVWSATTGTEPAPRFTLDVVVTGEAGETRFLRVSQRCGERVERWVGTPDEPAEQPAIRLRLDPPDPTRPPPPLSEPAPTPAPVPAPGTSAPTPAPTPPPAPADAPADAPVVAGAAVIASLAAALVTGLVVRRRRRVPAG